MKAVVQDVYGSTDALAVEEIAVQAIADDEVLVRDRNRPRRPRCRPGAVHVVRAERRVERRRVSRPLTLVLVHALVALA